MNWREDFLDIGIYVDEQSVIDDLCEIGVGCVIKNSVIKKGAVVLPYCVIKESIIESGATIGPFANLREGSHIGKNAKIGAFVETKKSIVGQKSKIPHLSYVGDIEIGENCNIGCGVIVCNYDGKEKYKTIIGDGCFIGSNCNLVAPVKIENGAYIAAGSTITNDVPADSFAIARARQENKEMPERLRK